jgi:hypothetical protein
MLADSSYICAGSGAIFIAFSLWDGTIVQDHNPPFVGGKVRTSTDTCTTVSADACFQDLFLELSTTLSVHVPEYFLTVDFPNQQSYENELSLVKGRLLLGAPSSNIKVFKVVPDRFFVQMRGKSTRCPLAFQERTEPNGGSHEF